MSSKIRALELYCGIGGFAAAAAGRLDVAAAYDVNEKALDMYRANFGHDTAPIGLESAARERFAAAEADLWWLSPPCQPFTRRGRQRDDDDPRSHSLLALLDHVEALRPSMIAFENVPGFAGSRTHGRLRTVLDGAGYQVAERLLCPTELGVPMRRRRFYLVAAHDAPLAPWLDEVRAPRPLRAFIDHRHDHDPGLAVAPSLERDYRGALHIVERDDPDAVCACFTSGYGRSPVRSGSYLRVANGRLRRFHPREILRLMGFPPGFARPGDLDHKRAWRLAGNSLSVDAVRVVLGALPGVS